LSEAKAFGTNPAAKTTLETNNVSSARRRNTKHTEEKKEKIFWLPHRSVSNCNLPLLQKVNLNSYFIPESYCKVLGYTS